MSLLRCADKLSETKKAEREIKEAHKADLQAKKQRNHEARVCDRVLLLSITPVQKHEALYCRKRLLSEQLSKRSVQSAAAPANVQQQMHAR